MSTHISHQIIFVTVTQFASHEKSYVLEMQDGCGTAMILQHVIAKGTSKCKMRNQNEFCKYVSITPEYRIILSFCYGYKNTDFITICLIV